MTRLVHQVNYILYTHTSINIQAESVVTVGNFDGVHLGHQQIFAKVDQIAKEKKINPLAFSFSPHPREVLGNIRVALLTTMQQRAEKIGKLFPSVAYGKIAFDLALSEKTAKDFLSVLMDTFRMRDLVVGTTTHIGKNREGTPERIQELAESMGFRLHLIAPHVVGERVVSSSLIRNCIGKGEVQEIPGLMGEAFTTTGEVVHGQHLGQALGFPTANIACFSSQLLPANGVYAGWAWVEGVKYPAAINLGYRPTLQEDNVMRYLEVHIIGHALDLYGASLTVEWVRKVRDEIKFNSLEMLKKQVSNDVSKIQNILKK